MELITKRLPVKEILLMPVGDIQWAGDDAEVALGMLKRHIEWGVERGAWFLGMGDYVDLLSPSNRDRLRAASLYDTAAKALDQAAEKLVEELYEKALAPSKGRWLGLLSGHHFFQYEDGSTSDQSLAVKLGAPFLGTSAYVRLQFGKEGAVLLWAHHGAGSSVAVGGALNRLSRVIQGFEADVYLMGHHHKKDGVPLDRVFPAWDGKGGPVLLHRTKLLVVTGSFLKGYQVGRAVGGVPRGSYVEQGMLNPVQLGAPLVKIRPRTQMIGGQKVWVPDLGVEL